MSVTARGKLKEALGDYRNIPLNQITIMLVMIEPCEAHNSYE
jgi:hypothetical protein